MKNERFSSDSLHTRVLASYNPLRFQRIGFCEPIAGGEEERGGAVSN